MKKALSLTLAVLALVFVSGMNQVQAQKTYKVTAKAPYVSPSLKPIIAVYRSGDYLSAMIDLEKLVKKEPNNMTAKYYLALCYTKLGYRPEATTLYNEVVESNANMTLVHYADKALRCIDQPDSEGCTDKPDYSVVPIKAGQDDSDMAKFIRSGERFHPSVQDQITKDRMERKLQHDEYVQKQNPNLKSEVPTNEEIAQALNTLSKIGMNPYNQGYSMAMFANPYQGAYLSGANYPNMLSSNPEMAKMMMYNQLNRQLAEQFSYGMQTNNFNTFGL